jgi:hypothetical protein
VDPRREAGGTPFEHRDLIGGRERSQPVSRPCEALRRILPAVEASWPSACIADVATSARLERDRSVIDEIAVKFTDAAGVAPNIASVLMGHAIAEPQLGATQGHTRQANTPAPAGRGDRARKAGAYLCESHRAEVAGE